LVLLTSPILIPPTVIGWFRLIVTVLPMFYYIRVTTRGDEVRV